MSQTLPIIYNNPANFTLSSLMSVTSKSQLALDDLLAQDFSQGFLADTGFTYDAALAQFLAGQVEQIDQRPTNYLLGANFNLSKDANWSVGDTTITLNDGAILSDDKIVMSTTQAHILIEDSDNIPANNGCIRFDYTHKYSGNITSLGYLVVTTGAGRFFILMNTTGTIGVTFYNNASGAWAQSATGVIPWVLDQTYELELNWDATAGFVNLYVDKNREINVTSTSGTKDGIADQLFIGSYINGSTGVKCDIDNLVMFSEAQHTAASYSDDYSILDYIYAESKVDLPQFVYPGVGAIQAYTNFVTTQTSDARMIYNGEYWNGSAWAASSDTYATASSPADILANLATASVSDTVDISVVFGDSNTQQAISNLVTTYTGQIYPVVHQSAQFNTTVPSDGIISLSETSAVIPSGDSLTYSPIIGGVKKWYNIVDLEWQVSTGGTQSNTLAEFNLYAADLNLLAGADVTIIMYMISGDGSTTPEIVSNDMEYSFFAHPISCSLCVVYGYMYYNCVADAGTVAVKSNPNVQTKNANFFAIDELINARASGYFEFSVPRESVMDVKIAINDVKKTDGTITIPDLASKPLDELLA